MKLDTWLSGLYIGSFDLFFYPFVLFPGIYVLIMWFFEGLLGQTESNATYLIITAIIWNLVLVAYAFYHFTRFKKQDQGDDKVLLARRWSVIAIVTSPFLFLLFYFLIDESGNSVFGVFLTDFYLMFIVLLALYCIEVLEVYYVYRGIEDLDKATIADNGPKGMVISLAIIVAGSILYAVLSSFLANYSIPNTLSYLLLIIFMIPVIIGIEYSQN